MTIASNAQLWRGEAVACSDLFATFNTMDTDTPRTDEALSLHYSEGDYFGEETTKEAYEFARKLERELNGKLNCIPLFACPICHSAKWVGYITKLRGRYQAVCDGCNHHGPPADTPDEARRLWNLKANAEAQTSPNPTKK